MNTQIFREYDIRGVADRDLTDDVTTQIGKAFGTLLRRHQKKSCVIGRDDRVSSPRLHKALVQGILSTGIHATDIGLCPTPQLYFAIQHLKKEGGIMITGSHNPPDQNGFKMCLGLMSISGETIQELCQWIKKGDLESGQGKSDVADIAEEYSAYFLKQFKFKKKIKVGLDCGNGMNAMNAPKVLKQLGCDVHELYCKVDCRFPNHPADPSKPETLTELTDLVKKNKLDVGIAFDGDGDRVGAVDEKGNIIPGDMLMILYSRYVLQSQKNAVILGDVKCSQRLYDDIEAHGGKPLMWKTGHSLIKKKMKEVDAAIGGEMSGHMFFRDRFFGFDSSLYAALRLLEIVDQSEKPLSSLLEDVPPMCSTPEIRVDCADDKKFDVVQRVVSNLKQENYQVNDLDGARVTFEDGWGLLRASNTQPVLVMRFEAKTQKRLDEIQGFIENKVKEFSK